MPDWDTEEPDVQIRGLLGSIDPPEDATPCCSMPSTLEADLEMSDSDLESEINSDAEEQVLELLRSPWERARTAVTLPVWPTHLSTSPGMRAAEEPSPNTETEPLCRVTPQVSEDNVELPYTLVPYSHRLVTNITSPQGSLASTAEDSPAKEVVMSIIQDLLMLAHTQETAILYRFLPALESAHLEISSLLDSEGICSKTRKDSFPL